MWINTRTVQKHMRATPRHHFMLATRQRSEELRAAGRASVHVAPPITFVRAASLRGSFE